ncbi:NusG domain II-containing protein [Megamonas funiformis]|uniref:NusG domain II-containing protein n=1 Tax=Megamonas funiformis TaxID=437897 RepID=UPI001431BCE9|nr:NusG domain II-containing protein [Megamonas funiformis]NJE28123.1 NusG domain II-containing protein [Megamonas funiformis]
MNNINKSVICIILGIIFIVVFIGLKNSFAEKTNIVEIIQDGNIIYTLDLNKSKDELIQAEFKGHKNIIQIKDKQISIIEADCPDKTCVNMGILKSAFTPIVCLPNHLVIQYVNDDKEIDATVN